MSLFSNKQMRIIFIYCVIIILVICGIITARHKKTSSDSIVKTTKINNETSESSDTQHTSDNTPNTDRLPPYNSSNQGNGIGGGAIMGNCSIGSRKLPIYCVDLSKKTNLDTSKKYVSISFDAAWGDEDTIKILDILDKYNIKTTFFMTGGWVDSYPDNPTTDTVEEALAIYKDNKCDCIIGFGGGSSMDCAKAVGVRIARPKTHLSKLGGILKVHAKLPLLVAIPTTAGTGSETTLAAVIVDATTRHKYAINDFPLIPRYAVLDPKVTLTLPASITATTGMDALTHAVEAYIGNSTTPGTRKDALMATELIFNNLDRAYTNGSDTTARKNMLKAAYYAGCAFTKSYVGYIHAVAHSLGGEYNVPHGLANAVILPMVLESYGESIYTKLHDLAIAAGVADKDMPDETAAKAFIQAVKDMKARFNIGDTIPEIKEEDIPKLAGYADKEANPLYPVPVLMDAKTLEQFYYKLMKDNTHENEV